MQKLKMCTNLFLWSICLFFIIFLYYCPGHTIGHANHRLEPTNGYSGGRSGSDIHGTDDPFIASEEKCPCISRNQCPRIYGETATDVKELGFLKPCKEFGTVRCCGVTVSIRIEHEKDGDRDDVFDKLKRSHTRTVEDTNGSEKNLTSFSPTSIVESIKHDGVIDEGGLHSNFLWDRDEDLDVAESNQSNIESGQTSGSDEAGKSSGVTSLPARPAMKLRPRKKLRANGAGLGSRAANLKDKIMDMNLKSTTGNDGDNDRANKELNAEKSQPDLVQSTPEKDSTEAESTNSPVAGTQEMSKISKLRIVRPGGPKMRRVSQQAQEINNQDEKTSHAHSSPLPVSSGLTNEGDVQIGPSFVPRTRKRILRRKKINKFAPSSSESDPIPLTPVTDFRENEANQEFDGPVPAFILPPQSHSEPSIHEADVPEPDTNLPSTTSTHNVNANKFLNKHGPHSVLRRKPIIPRPHLQVDNEREDSDLNKNSNTFNTDNSEDVSVPRHSSPFKFPRFNGNSASPKSSPQGEAVENASNLEEVQEAKTESESEVKEIQPEARPSPISGMKPLRKRLRPIRPAVEKLPGSGHTSTSSDSSQKVSILTPADSKPNSEASQISTSYTKSSSSSSYPNPIRKLQKLRKRIRPMQASTPTPVSVTTEYPAYTKATETKTTIPVEKSPVPNVNAEVGEHEEAIKIEAPATPKYKFSSGVSYTESKRKNGIPTATKVFNTPGRKSESPPRGDSLNKTTTNEDEGTVLSKVHPPIRVAETELDVDAVTTKGNEGGGSDIPLIPTIAETDSEFESTSPTLPSPEAPIPVSTPQENMPRPTQPPTYTSYHHNRQNVRLRTHTKNEDEEETLKYDTEEKAHKTSTQKVRYSHERIRKPQPTSSTVEYETTPTVTSTYSKIRVGNSNRHKSRPEIDEDDVQVDTQYQNNKLMTPAPQAHNHFIVAAGAPKKSGSRRFSIPSTFNMFGGVDGATEYKPSSGSSHVREEEGEESYDVILDKDVRHNLRKPTHNRLAPATDVSQEETRTLEFVNRPPASSEPKRMRIRRPTTTKANDETLKHRQRLHTKVEYGEVGEVEVHADLAPTEKYTNYEHIKSTTPFPPYKPRSTVPSATASPITSSYSGSGNSNSKRRRVEKPSLLLESERKRPDTEDYAKNTNYPTESTRIGSQYSHQYTHNYDEPETYTITTTERPTTAAPYVYHHPNTKAKEHNTKDINNYYFNEVSTTPAYYIHTSPLPSKAENEEEEASPKFVFPPYRFEITSKPATEKDEQQKSKHVAPEIVYSATVPPPTSTPRPRYVSPVSTEGSYYHQIAPTESPYNVHYPSTTAMPPPSFMYYTSTGIPTKEDDGQYHRHHHLHYTANNENVALPTSKPSLSSVSFTGGFMPIRSNNASSNRFHIPEGFGLPSHLNSNSAPSYEETPVAPVTPSPVFSYTSHSYNNEAKSQYDNVVRFPGHVEIGGTKRPVSVQVKVAGLNGQTHHPQHVQLAGASQKPQLQTMIDIQNPRETSPDYVKHQYQHYESPHATRLESGNNVPSSNPDGLQSFSTPSPIQQQYQYFGKDNESGSLGKFSPGHHQINFGTAVQTDEASINNHAPSVVQQHNYKPLQATPYGSSPHAFNQMPSQTHGEFNSVRNQVQTTINITNPLANSYQQYLGGLVPTASSPLSFGSAFENSFKSNAFQQHSVYNEPNFKEQTHTQLSTGPIPTNTKNNQHMLNGLPVTHQSTDPSLQSGANLHSLNSLADGNAGPQPHVFRHNANGMFPAPHHQNQQPVIQFIQSPRPLNEAATPSSVWKFPTSEPQLPQHIAHQNQPSKLVIPEVESGQYNHQLHTLQYQTEDYGGNGIRGSPLSPNQQMPPSPQHQLLQSMTGGPREVMNRPHTNSVIQFGTAVGPNDGQMKGPNMNAPFNAQMRPSNTNLPAGHVRIPQQAPHQQQGKNLPHYIKEYHQHHSISQEILSQLKNSNRFNPFSGNARTSRATNLDDIEIIKASQDTEAAAAETNENVGTKESALDTESSAPVSVLSTEEKNDVLNNLNFVVVGKKEESEKDKNANEKETAFTQPEVVSYFSLPETARSLDSELDDENEADTSKLPNESSGVEGKESEDGTTFSEPKTIQRGFLPIVPYSESDPGPLLVNVKDFNGAAGRDPGRASKALEDGPPRVVVTLTDDDGTPRPNSQI